MANRKPHLIFQPRTYQSLQRGVKAMVSSVRPTMGPLPRLVAVTPLDGHGAPVLFDNGGEIVRHPAPAIWNRFLEGFVYLDPDNTTVLVLIREIGGQYAVNYQMV